MICHLFRICLSIRWVSSTRFVYTVGMPLTAKIGKRGQMTLPRDVRLRYGLEEGQTVAFVIKHGELTLVPLRKTLFDFKGSVQGEGTTDLETIREQVAREQAARIARGE